MEDIKVGEYVRTTDGYIKKVIGFNVDNEPVIDGYYDGGKHLTNFEIKHFIVKHSPNIIDLIEVGDYVNGYKVSYKESTLLFTDVKGIDRSGYHIPISQYGDNIKSIVTKEQFESVEFRLEG